MLHVICGAPCSGKTTYVQDHASENALIIDADKIASAFGGSDYHAKGEPLKVALDARDLAIKHALKSESEAWLIDTMPTDERLKQYADVGADVVLLDTSKDECLKRAKERPEGTTEQIAKWFDNVDTLKKLLNRREPMNETVNQETNEQLKTFTQEELDTIVKERLAREKGKYADYEELKAKAMKFDEVEENNKSELQKAQERAESLQAQLEKITKANTVRDIRAKVAQSLGVPEVLLTGEDEETCTAQAKNILEFAQKKTYPTVPDGGETHAPTVTKAEIMSIKNEKERLKALEIYLKNGGK